MENEWKPLDELQVADGALHGELSTALINQWDASRTPHGSIRAGTRQRLEAAEETGQDDGRDARDASGAMHCVSESGDPHVLAYRFCLE